LFSFPASMSACPGGRRGRVAVVGSGGGICAQERDRHGAVARPGLFAAGSGQSASVSATPGGSAVVSHRYGTGDGSSTKKSSPGGISTGKQYGVQLNRRCLHVD